MIGQVIRFSSKPFQYLHELNYIELYLSFIYTTDSKF